jgi:hypothetical protein
MLTHHKSFRIINDRQCLATIDRGRLIRIRKDPALRETYRSIAWGGHVIYLQTLGLAKPTFVDSFGLSILQSMIAACEYAELEADKERKCQISVEHLFLLIGRGDLLDGERDLKKEELYISGKTLLDILERAGYESPELYYGFTIEDPKQLYYIPWFYIETQEDGELIVDLIPDNICDIVNGNYEDPRHDIEQVLAQL